MAQSPDAPDPHPRPAARASAARIASLIPPARTPFARPGSLQSHFLEIEVTELPDAMEFRHARENTFGQMTVMGMSVFLFMLFVVSIMPRMHLGGLAATLWTVLGVAILLVIGLVMYAQTRSTTLRLDLVGVSLEQGTAVDRESVAIPWEELAGAELEPVDPKDARKGMQLQLRPRQGEPVNTLAGLAIAELNEVRRIIGQVNQTRGRATDDGQR